MMQRTYCFLIAILCLLPCGAAGADGPLPRVDHTSPMLRRPVSMDWLREGHLIVANRTAGTLMTVDATERRVTGEYLIGGTPEQVLVLPRQRLAVIDSRQPELLIVGTAAEFSVLQRFPLSGPARSLAVLDENGTLAVSMPWNWSVGLYQQDPGTGDYKHHAAIALDFQPGQLLAVPQRNQIIVADAFDGNLAAIQVDTGQVNGRHRILGINIRGLALNDQQHLLISHQRLHPTQVTAEQIASGGIIENVHLDVELTFSSAQVQFRPLYSRELGVPSNGAADPGAIAIAGTGERLVLLSGVGELAVLNPRGELRSRIDVGGYPSALCVHPTTGSSAYIMSSYSQSLAIVDIAKREIETVALGPQGPTTAAQRGEELFHAGRMSRFGWMSCASCHPAGHAVTAVADTAGDGGFGAPKRVLSLLGGRDNNPWAWNGSQRTLHEQVFKSFRTTMHGPAVSAQQVNDVVAYLHTLPFPPPREPISTDADSIRLETGKQLFHSLGCVACHIPPLTYTSDGLFDVGLVDEVGQKKFNSPALKGVSQRRGFFHDGRATTLRDVFEEHGHQLNRQLSEEELEALLRFLNSL